MTLTSLRRVVFAHEHVVHRRCRAESAVHGLEYLPGQHASRDLRLVREHDTEKPGRAEARHLRRRISDQPKLIQRDRRICPIAADNRLS